MTVLTPLGPVDTVESRLDSPPVAAPRLLVVVRGGRAGRAEALDTPTDADGLGRLVGWLTAHEGWAIASARVEDEDGNPIDPIAGPSLAPRELTPVEVIR